MPGTTWQPTAAQAALAARATLLRYLRDFFHARQVMEVETPLLGRDTVTDPHIDAIACADRWLQTSPEYAMKRLLAAGSGPIFQVCKAFRAGEAGARHNPEFSMLEWYRPGFTLDQLIDEVLEFVGGYLEEPRRERWTYRDLFTAEVGVDPFTATTGELESAARATLDCGPGPGDRDGWLDLLFSHTVEPALAARELVVVEAYPASQAALARIDGRGEFPVAARFELYCRGVELANGYHELADPVEQRDRFDADLARRERLGKPARRPDARLLQALEHGLGDVCGVALGLDRLLMLALASTRIADVLSFDWERA